MKKAPIPIDINGMGTFLFHNLTVLNCDFEEQIDEFVSASVSLSRDLVKFFNYIFLNTDREDLVPAITF